MISKSKSRKKLIVKDLKSSVRNSEFLQSSPTQNVGSSSSSVGRDIAIGIDCGGTNLKLAAVKANGEMLHFKIEPIKFDEAPEKVIAKIVKSIKKFISEYRIKDIVGVGMGIAGDLDPKEGFVRFSPNLNWRNVPVKKTFLNLFQTPLIVENDANCAGWGAYCLDAKRDCDNLLCLTLGTGIGGGIVLNKKLYRGVCGSAGEIGHMTIQFNGRPCKCGSFGCLESMVGAWGLVQSALEGLKRGVAPVLKKMVTKEDLNPQIIALAAQQGDAFCQQLWKEAGEMLGSALANCVNIFNPDRIVLCGGVSKVGTLLLAPALHTLGRRAFATAAQKVKVTISQFDERLGVVGAALLFWE